MPVSLSAIAVRTPLVMTIMSPKSVRYGTRNAAVEEASSMITSPLCMSDTAFSAMARFSRLCRVGAQIQRHARFGRIVFQHGAAVRAHDQSASGQRRQVAPYRGNADVQLPGERLRRNALVGRKLREQFVLSVR